MVEDWKVWDRYKFSPDTYQNFTWIHFLYLTLYCIYVVLVSYLYYFFLNFKYWFFILVITLYYSTVKVMHHFLFYIIMVLFFCTATFFPSYTKQIVSYLYCFTFNLDYTRKYIVFIIAQAHIKLKNILLKFQILKVFNHYSWYWTVIAKNKKCLEFLISQCL